MIAGPQPGSFVSTRTTPSGGNERRGITASAFDHEEVVADFLDLGDVRLLGRLSGNDADDTDGKKHSQKHRPPHRSSSEHSLEKPIGAGHHNSDGPDGRDAAREHGVALPH